jgi:hypothetical protein
MAHQAAPLYPYTAPPYHYPTQPAQAVAYPQTQSANQPAIDLLQARISAAQSNVRENLARIHEFENSASMSVGKAVFTYLAVLSLYAIGGVMLGARLYDSGRHATGMWTIIGNFSVAIAFGIAYPCWTTSYAKDYSDRAEFLKAENQTQEKAIRGLDKELIGFLKSANPLAYNPQAQV